MFRWVRRNVRWVVPVAVVVGVVGAWVLFGFFGVHTLFVDDEVNEEAPVFASGADQDVSEVDVQYRGSFVDRSHPAEGVAEILNDGTTQRFLRFEDFATDNGPDLNVYLTTAPADAPAGEFDDEFVDLGDLKGNLGSQNYEIPPDVELDRFSTVVIWCVRFGVAFGAAELVPA